MRTRSLPDLTHLLCMMTLALFGGTRALAQPCTADLLGVPASSCAGVGMNGIAVDTTGGMFGSGVVFSWSADVPGSFSCTNCIAPVFTATVPVITTNNAATITVTVSGPACPSVPVSMDLTLLATPQAGLSASTTAGAMVTSNAYADQLTFVLCGAPVPASTLVSFSDNSTGGPGALSLTGDWGNITMPGGSGNFPAGLQTGTYTITHVSTGCSDALEVGMLIGPTINSLGAQIGLNGSAFGCAGEPLDFVLNPTGQNPPGVIYTIHESYDLPPTADHIVAELLGLSAGTIHSNIFPVNSCNGTHAGGPHTAGLEVTPAYGCYQGPNLTPTTSSGVYISDPPIAQISAPAETCIGTVLFDNDSQGAWIDNLGVCHTVPENGYWTVSGPAGGWTGGTLGNDGGTPDEPWNWNAGSDPLTLDFSICGTYTITLTVAGSDSCGISSYQHVIDIQEPPPPFTFTVSGAPACADYAPDIQNLGPSALACGGAYSWTVVNMTSICATAPGWNCVDCTDIFEPDITFTGPGTYTLTAELDNGCPGSETYVQTIDVGAPPLATIDASASATCIGGTVTATVTVEDCGDAAGLSYAWTFGNTNDAGTGSPIAGWNGPVPPPLGPIVAGTDMTLDVVVTNSCGNAVAGQVAIPVTAAAPVLALSSNGPVCEGEPLELEVVGGPVGATYAWATPSGASFSSGVDLVLLSVDPAIGLMHEGMWTVSTGSGVCAANGSLDVVIHPQPVLSIVASDAGPLCTGDPPIDLVASEVGNTVGSYQWQNGGPASNVWIGVVPVAPTTTYVMDFTATATGCTAQADISIAVVDVGSVVANAPSGPICPQAVAVPLDGDPDGGTWTIDSGPGSIVGGPPWSYVPAAGSAGANVVLRYSYAVGSCSGSATTSFTIQAIPNFLVPAQYACGNDAPFLLSTAGLPPGSYTAMPPIVDASGNFHPALAGGGTLTNVEYCINANTSCAACATGTVQVLAAPVIAPFDPVVVCDDTGPYVLPMPFPNGTWSGPHVEPPPTAFIFNTDLAPGSAVPYVPTYTVTDASNANVTCTSTADLSITVLPAPTAAFTVPPGPFCVNTAVPFNNTSTPGVGGTISGWIWDFGDPGSANNTSTEGAPTHVFATGDTYTVTLTVTQANCTSVFQQEVQVQDQPMALIAPQDTTICSGQPVAFHNLSTGTELSYLWSLDPGSSTAFEPGNVIYSAALPCDTLTHHITLTVDNAACPASAAHARVFVIPPLDPSFLLSTDTVCSLQDLTVFNTTDCPWMDPTVTWDWQYPDGDDQPAPDDPLGVSHQYANTGYDFIQFTIGLTVTNACFSNTTTRIVIVASENIVAAFTVEPTSGCAPFSAQFDQSMVGVTEWTWDFDHPNGDGSLLEDPAHIYDEPGAYDVRLGVSNGCVSGELIVPVVAEPPPILLPVAEPSPACWGTIMEFSLGGPPLQNVIWQFDDPLSGAANTANGSSVAHLFTAPNDYSVTVNAQDPLTGCPGSAILSVTVLDTLNATIAVTPSSGCPPLEVELQSTNPGAAQVVWTIADASGPVTALGADVTHVFETPGTYTVRAMVSHPSGCTDSAFAQIVVHEPVHAVFVLDPDSSCTTPVQVDFNNLSTGPAPLAFTWSFGVPGAGSIASDPSYTYAQPAAYEACLTVTSLDGCTDVACAPVHVFPTPIARFLPPVLGCVGLEVLFEQAITVGESHWSFGDGSTSNTPSHIYSTPGTYDVTLVVVGPGGCTDSTTIAEAVTIRPSPIAAFAADFVENSSGVPVYDFTDLSTGADSVHWDFGDGITSNEHDPRHEFPGVHNTVFDVCLTAFNAWGCWDTVCTQYTISTEGNVFVPNAFTPDGDGKNDLFHPVINGYDNCEDYEFLIFDRWGLLVAHFTDRERTSWDGIYNGAPAVMDVYVWKLRFGGCRETEPERKTFEGHVSLLR